MTIGSPNASMILAQAAPAPDEAAPEAPAEETSVEEAPAEEAVEETPVDTEPADQDAAAAGAETAPVAVEAVPADGDLVGEVVQPADDPAPAYGSSIWADTNLWLWVALAILALMVYRPTARAVLSALDGRSARIKQELEQAQQLREEAQRMLAEYQRRQRDALSEAEEILTHARQEAERLKEKATADLDALLQRREAAALDRIAQAEQAAQNDVRMAAAELAVVAASRAVAEHLDGNPAVAAAMIDRAIEDMPKNLTQ